MRVYMGIVITQSLHDERILQELDIVARRVKGSWEFLYIRVLPEDIYSHIKVLQQHMIDKQVDCWYNHYFKDEKLIVVYQDKFFDITTNEDTWKHCIQYGLENGIPEKQLDFTPRTFMDANSFFGVKLEK